MNRSTLTFEPMKWKSYIEATCYSYALNMFVDKRFYIGDIYPGSRAEVSCSDDILQKILVDELKILGFSVKVSNVNGENRKGFLICIVRERETGYYHFYRRDNVGWSHKRPGELPTRFNKQGKILNGLAPYFERGYENAKYFWLHRLL